MRLPGREEQSEMHGMDRLNALADETVAQLDDHVPDPSLIQDNSYNENPILNQLHSRLRRNDPTLTTLSLCRLPVFHLTFGDVAMLVESLVHNQHVKDLELWIPATDDGGKDADGDEIMHDSYGAVTIETSNDRNAAGASGDIGQIIRVTDYASFAAALAASTSVESLTVTHAPSGEAWCTLFEALKASPSVRHLVVGEATLNPIPFTDMACRGLASLISSSCRLQSLTMRGICMTLEDARTLSVGLCRARLDRLELHQVEIRTNLSDPDSSSSLLFGQFVVTLASAPIASLAILDCDLRLEGVDEDFDHPLTAFAATASYVRSLSLLDSIDVDGIRPLALGLLSNPSSQLSVLDLRYNTISVISCEALSELLARPESSLQELLLDDASLDDDCVQTLCSDGLALNESLRKLTLRGNSLSARSCSALEAALCHHPGLRVLDVSENHLKDAGAANLASLFRRNSSLREVVLEATNLTDAGVTTVLAGLAHNRHVTTLRLGRNQVRDRAAHALSNLLGSNCTLSELDLSSCQISDDALVNEILPGLCRNHTLQSLCLAYNAIGNVGVRALGRALPALHVRSLDLQFNDFDSVGLEPLARGLVGNYLLYRVNVTNESTQHAETAADQRRKVWVDQISRYTSLNRAGRRAIQHDATIPPSLRPTVLAKAAATTAYAFEETSPGPCAVFHILRNQPHYPMY